ncbi:MAG: hypothetical protein FWG20_00170 [Candidatus Cloacimonetes bacterium]|nr:hypothetical protein [Candidatus Cloacimonadota bacterium]
MKKLITIIILALLIATAGAEETVYRKMTAEELTREAETELGALIDDIQIFHTNPIRISGIISSINADNSLWIDGYNETNYILMRFAVSEKHRFKRIQTETNRHFGETIFEGYVAGDIITVVSSEYKFVNNYRGNIVYISNAVVID